MTFSSYENRICAMFDSFCKIASRNYYLDLLWAEKRWDSHYHEETVEYLLKMLSYEDKYASESFGIYAGRYFCVVESETLYKALLSPQGKTILEFLTINGKRK